MLNFSTERLSKLHKDTDREPTLRMLKQVIIDRWPENIKCHTDIRPFFNFRECLAVEDGLIFKGPQVIIPKSNRKSILQQLHASHQGVRKTQALARDCVYWPGICKQIEAMINGCDVCQKYQPLQRNEPTLHHHIPPAPLTKLGSDPFQVGEKHYLLIVDYFTNFPSYVNSKQNQVWR